MTARSSGRTPLSSKGVLSAPAVGHAHIVTGSLVRTHLQAPSSAPPCRCLHATFQNTLYLYLCTIILIWAKIKHGYFLQFRRLLYLEQSSQY